MPTEGEDVRYERIDGVLYKIGRAASGGMMYEYKERVEEEPAEEVAPGVHFEDVVFDESGEPVAARNERAVVEQAHRLADVLLTSADEGRYVSQEGAKIYTADVEADAVRFSAQVNFCRDAQVNFPCLSSVGRVPVPVDFAFGGSFPQHDPVFAANVLPQLYQLAVNNPQMFSSTGAELGGYAPTEARGFFKELLSRFLASRLFAPPPVRKDVGVKFRVYTSTPGLRVHYSPAYFRNPALVFGSPTSPVENYLKSGRWVFGVMGKGMTGPQFSEAEFNVPQDTEARLVEW